MIKLMMCLCRRSGMSRAEFQDYWRNQHGPFFQKNAGTMRSRKYIQSHTIDWPLNDSIDDLVACLLNTMGFEVWFKHEDKT